MRLIWILCSVVLGCGEDPPFPEDYQTSWQEVVPCSQGSAHDGNSVRIFVNDLAQSTWADWKQRVADSELGILPPGEMIEFQPGAVLLKAEYGNSNCSSLKNWKMMTRLVVGGDTANGNWRWETVLPDEDQRPQQPEANGAACFDCHQNYRRTDYVGNSAIVP